MKRSGQRELTIWIFLVPLTVAAACTCLAFAFGGSSAIAAERVLEPDRVLMAPPASQPLEPPLLAEGENLRFPGGYKGETVALPVSEADLYRGFLILINSVNHLPFDYVPVNLVVSNNMAETVNQTSFAVTKYRLELQATVLESLLTMINEAWTTQAIGGYLLQSGYRDFYYQTSLHQNKIQEYRNQGYEEAEAVEAAAFWVAKPGESEHQTGLCMDLSSRSHPELEPSYAATDNGKWLAENCWRYGFIVRYAEDKSDITRIGFEPWHIRYTGRPHSDLIQQKGWCLEEYMDFLITEGGYTFRDEEGQIWQVDYQPFGQGSIQVPADLPYTLSGDGGNGFIVTVLLESE